jgi:F-type H+-transporting ATPase subunit epsilon
VRLRVLLPDQIIIDQQVLQVTAEAENGSFSLLPRHIDFVTALVPGILTFLNEQEQEEFLAVDDGVLIKCGQDVRVSVKNAVRGKELGELRSMIHEQFRVINEHEQKARDALNKLEVDLIRRFMEMG